MADEPMRLEGLRIIFEEHPQEGDIPLLPVFGSMEELLNDATLEYLLIDLNSTSIGLMAVKAIRRARPALRLIVLGPGGSDEQAMDALIAGARAYLDLSVEPKMVRQALDVVIAGHIWAPRRLLSKLIDRLLAFPDTSLTSANPHLTCRERQVLDLILMARSNREIARQLGIEERTVKAHVSSLMRKTGVDNRIELSVRALHLALASQPSGSSLKEPVEQRGSVP
jgi:DNA-binding NarL/FixJ family response regulator